MMARPLIGVNLHFDIELEKNIERFSVNANYVDTLWAAGGMPRLVPCPTEEHVSDWLDGLDGFLFIGGPDYPPELYGAEPHKEQRLLHPRRSAADMALARSVLKRELPILGICGGLQAVAIAMGGGLIQHLEGPLAHRSPPFGQPLFHSARLLEGSRLREIFGKEQIEVNTYHHQAVHPDKVPDGLRVAALAEDGTIEALEGNGSIFRLLLQWHPEKMEESHWRPILTAFVRACL